MVRIYDLPLKVQGFHRPVHLAHDVVRLALAPDSEVPLAPLDGRAAVSLGGHRGHGLDGGEGGAKVT